MKKKISVFLFSIIKFVTAIFPFKNTILFESNPDFADNALAVYNEMLKRKINKKYKIIWLLNNPGQYEDLPPNVSVINRTGSLYDKLVFYYTLARSKFIVDSNVYVKKVHKKQIRVHLKHGLPIKDSSFYTQNTGAIDTLCVPSDYWINICSKEHNIATEFIKPLGFPRNDNLVAKPHKFKTIMWMPTYRKNSFDKDINNSFDFNAIMPLGLPFVSGIETLQEINELFKKNDAYLLIRLHPAQDTSGITLSDMSNIKICNDSFIKSNNTTLYEILNYTDSLISDYSSIYYDYLHLNKPIALATYDFDHYKKHNGIIAENYEDFKNSFPSVFVESYEDLIGFFNDIFSENPDAYKCTEAKEKYIGDCGNQSAKKIVDFMITNYNL